MLYGIDDTNITNDVRQRFDMSHFMEFTSGWYDSMNSDFIDMNNLYKLINTETANKMRRLFVPPCLLGHPLRGLARPLAVASQLGLRPRAT